MRANTLQPVTGEGVRVASMSAEKTSNVSSKQDTAPSAQHLDKALSL